MDFDPYKQWLRIEATSQPNYYELLGIPVFTEDLETVRELASRVAEIAALPSL